MPTPKVHGPEIMAAAAAQVGNWNVGTLGGNTPKGNFRSAPKRKGKRRHKKKRATSGVSGEPTINEPTGK